MVGPNAKEQGALQRPKACHYDSHGPRLCEATRPPLLDPKRVRMQKQLGGSGRVVTPRKHLVRYLYISVPFRAISDSSTFIAAERAAVNIVSLRGHYSRSVSSFAKFRSLTDCFSSELEGLGTADFLQ